MCHHQNPFPYHHHQIPNFPPLDNHLHIVWNDTNAWSDQNHKLLHHLCMMEKILVLVALNVNILYLSKVPYEHTLDFHKQIFQVIEESFQLMTIIITIHPINLRLPKIMGVPRMKPPKELQQSLKTWSAILRLSLNQMALFPRIWI